MTSTRILRLCELIQRELGRIIDQEVNDPRIGMVTVTGVELSEDLRHAKAFVSVLGDDDQKERSLRLLHHAGRFIRGRLAESINLRLVPRIRFILDESAENYLRIAEVLRQIHDEEEPGDDDGGSGDPEG
ncbi:MAG: 30S ribosome-binding factor RbfA [Candidatus Eisenbacteria bacterium]|nr:30S ribosome-binding factor RbfA [Candidatus Eisenbacteria bacterium]